MGELLHWRARILPDDADLRGIGRSHYPNYRPKSWSDTTDSWVVAY